MLDSPRNSPLFEPVLKNLGRALLAIVLAVLAWSFIVDWHETSLILMMDPQVASDTAEPECLHQFIDRSVEH